MTKKPLAHLNPKPVAVMVKESGAQGRIQYGNLEFGLLTVGTLTMSLQQSAK